MTTLVGARHPKRSRWRIWSNVGLLLSLFFLAHEIGMAASSGTAIMVEATSPSALHVVHLTDQRSASAEEHAESPPKTCADDCPPPGHCGLDRGAIPAANDGLDLTLQSIIAGCGVPIEWRDVAELTGVVEATAASPHDQQRVFQVLLI